MRARDTFAPFPGVGEGGKLDLMSVQAGVKGHLEAAFQWSPGAPVTGRSVAIAALAIAAPVLAGLALGRLSTGLTIGLGAMLLAAETPGAPSQAERSASAGSAIPPAALAVTSATVIAAAPWSDAAMIALAGGAAIVSGYSRPLAIASIRYVIYLILGVNLIESAGANRGWAALAFGLGALWNVAVRRMLAAAPKLAASSAAPVRAPTSAQRRAHWRRTLRELTGWQFAIRLVAGLTIASAVRQVWPTHHYGWLVLTVALLTQRQIEHLPVKTTQRAMGALLGVGLTWGILAGIASPVLLALVTCLLAMAATVARAGNYMAYSVISTPVILLVLDFGRRVEPALLIDRLVATAAGAAIVVALNFIVDRLLQRAARGQSASRRGDGSA